MAQRIDEQRCTRCGICLEECPNEGIEEIDGEFLILPALCTECYGFYASPRCREVCPADAIDDNYGEPQEDSLLAYRAGLLRPDRFPRD